MYPSNTPYAVGTSNLQYRQPNTQTGGGGTSFLQDVNPLLDQGWSYEDISARTGQPVDRIRSYADSTRPGYGVSGGQVQGATTSVGGGGGGGAGVDLSAYDQGIGNVQAGLNRLGTQQNSGYGAIESSYQDALNQLLLGKNRANQDYTNTKQTAATDYVGAKNTVGSQAGESLTGLQRLLGSRGAGGGSAARIAAPQAVARGASLQRADIGNTFGKNNQALDTNWGNFMTDYDNQVSSAGNQRTQQRQGLEQSIEGNRASLLQTLAQLTGQRAQAAGGNATGAAQPYLDQANSVLDRLSNYTTAPINFQTQAYQAPALSTYNPQATETSFQGQGSNDYFSPYLQALLGKKQQRQFA